MKGFLKDLLILLAIMTALLFLAHFLVNNANGDDRELKLYSNISCVVSKDGIAYINTFNEIEWALIKHNEELYYICDGDTSRVVLVKGARPKF